VTHQLAACDAVSVHFDWTEWKIDVVVDIMCGRNHAIAAEYI